MEQAALVVTQEQADILALVLAASVDIRALQVAQDRVDILVPRVAQERADILA
jgi:hypothetical protein